MKRTIINIDEELCNGCGLCVEGCHEGALQMIDGKARIVSELYCDGLGACIGECPVGAITLEEREAEPYDEIKVMERISPKGESTVLAHLNHLIDHNQHNYVEQAIKYIEENNLDFDLSKLKNYKKDNSLKNNDMDKSNIPKTGGCPGTKMMSFDNKETENQSQSSGHQSELRQWPIQLHLVNPQAPYFQNSDVLLAADCVAFASGEFHSKFLKGKSLAIACPKIDTNMDVYVDKLTAMIDNANINTLTVALMEVPCCNGLMHIAKKAVDQAEKKIPIKKIVIGIKGNFLKEEWVMG